jgi:radical SAM superfamily enzyme YgiQ (UPF0313 family)
MRTVYLADLRHNYEGVVSTDCMPLGVGYMKAVMDRDFPRQEVRSEVFAYASELLAAIEACPPDVLMVSNYVWNESLSRFCLGRAKKINPGMLAVMGGPNIPVESERQIEFVARRPEIDLYVLGEGDFLARDVVRHFLEANCSVAALGDRDIESCIYRRAGVLIRTEPKSRADNMNLNDIPSPWLTGVMDKFFDGKLAPLFETNRGCPFSCSFCVQGTKYYTKITQFEMERIRNEIDYIGRMIKERAASVGTLRIADANYGMYPRDAEISGYLGRAQRDYGWPTFVDATTGKNRAENVIRSMEQVNGGMVLYQAVQSLDEEVLRNIRRSNIKLSAYAQIAVHLRGRGLRSSTDLILGLPGESLKSHLGTLQKMIDVGTDQAHCFQAMMLKGSDMESIGTREQFKFGTKFRLGPKNFGEYGGEKVFDIEEIVVTTDSLSFDDYILCRKHHMTFSVFWNDSWFSDVVAVTKVFGVRASEWLNAMLDAMEADSGAAGQLLQDFVRETKGEIFDSEEECRAWLSDGERFNQLRRGQIGDNLMYKYRAIASFFVWDEVCRLALDATKRLLESRGAAEQIGDFDSLWRDLNHYVHAKHATGTDMRDLTRTVEVTMRHNIPAWIQDGAPLDVSPYRFTEPRKFVFRLGPDETRELEGALQVWTAKAIGLSKLITRIRYTAQVRDCKLADHLDLADVPAAILSNARGV